MYVGSDSVPPISFGVCSLNALNVVFVSVPPAATPHDGLMSTPVVCPIVSVAPLLALNVGFERRLIGWYVF